MFQNICVIKTLSSYHFFIVGNTGLYSVLNKPNGIKIGLLLYRLWQIHRQLLNNRRIAKSKTVLFQFIEQYLRDSSLGE